MAGPRKRGTSGIAPVNDVMSIAVSGVGCKWADRAQAVLGIDGSATSQNVDGAHKFDPAFR